MVCQNLSGTFQVNVAFSLTALSVSVNIFIMFLNPVGAFCENVKFSAGFGPSQKCMGKVLLT